MPETVGALLIGSIAPGALTGIGLGSSLSGLSIFGISLPTLVGSAAILGATIGLQAALQPSLPSPEDGTQPIKQAIPPRIRGYGRARLSGYYMLFEEAGGNSYDVIALHSGRIAGFVQFYLHDDPVSITGDGVVSSVVDGRYGTPGSFPVRIQYGLGEDNQSPSFFSIPAPIEEIWNGTICKGGGIAWLSLCCQGVKAADYPKIYPRGLPAPSAVADLSPVWDPRDGSQSRDNPATWRISYNPILQLIDYLTREDGGLGLDYDVILKPVINSWMIEAALCDQLVPKADGSFEPRYQSSGWFRFDNKPEDAISSMLSTCDGWLAEDGDGTLALKIGLYRTPSVTLTEQHIFDFSLNFGQPDEQTVNELDITFTDPTQAYAQVQTESLRDEGAISLSGIVRPQQLDLTWVQSNSQAQRLAHRAMQRLNPSISGSFVTDLYGLRALGERWVRLKYPFISGLQDCVVEIQPGTQIDLEAGRVTFNFNMIDTGSIESYNPATDEGTVPSAPAVLPPEMLPVPQNVTAATMGSATNGYFIRLTFDDSSRSDLTYAIRYQLTDDGSGGSGPWIDQAIGSVSSDGTTVTVDSTIIQISNEYRIEIASVGPSGSKSDWSDPRYITSADALLREDGSSYRREDGSIYMREGA